MACAELHRLSVPRPRRPEELRIEAGGGVVFSQAAHQIDAGAAAGGGHVNRVHAVTGNWDPQRDTEGAYSALLWFDNGAFASVTYSGYGHFDSTNGAAGEASWVQLKTLQAYGAARRRLAAVQSSEEEGAAQGRGYLRRPRIPARWCRAGLSHQHFGPVLVSCEKGDLRAHARRRLGIRRCRAPPPCPAGAQCSAWRSSTNCWRRWPVAALPARWPLGPLNAGGVPGPAAVCATG